MGIMYRYCKEHNSPGELTENTPKDVKILKCGIKLLQVLNFKAYDLIAKYISTNSQMQVIIKRIMSRRGELDFTNLEGN